MTLWFTLGVKIHTFKEVISFHKWMAYISSAKRLSCSETGNKHWELIWKCLRQQILFHLIGRDWLFWHMLDQSAIYSKEAHRGLSWQQARMEQVSPKGNSRMLVNNGFALFPAFWAVQIITYLAWSPGTCTPQTRTPDCVEATTAPGLPNITGLLSTLTSACKQIKEEFGDLVTL